MALRWKNQRREPDYANPDLMGGYRPASEGFPQEPTFEQILGNRAYQQMQDYVPGEPDAYRQDNGDAIYAAGLMQGYRPTPAYGETAFNPATASKADIVAMQKRLGVSADGLWGKKSQAAYDAAFGKQEPYTNFGRAAGGDAGAAAVQRTENMRARILQAIADKQAELDKIEAQIAEIDKSIPALKNNPKEWEIAAKRAEIGDMSAYDNLVSRGNQASSSVSGIENGLYNAAKELWGLSDEDDSQRNISRNTIEVELQKAEEWARKNNVDIETGMPRIYYDLRQKFNELVANTNQPGAGVTGGSLNFENANSVKAQLASLDKDGKLSDSHIKEIEKYNKENPNSKYAAELKAAADEYRYKTNEAKGRAAALKKEANDNIDKMEAMTPEAQDKFWRSLPTKTKKEMLKYGGWKTNNKKNPPVMYFARGK